jgi:hypothetical protein
MWLQLLKLVLSLAETFLGKAREKQLLDAGQSMAIQKALNAALNQTDNAINIRNAVSSNPDRVRDDPFDRD